MVKPRSVLGEEGGINVTRSRVSAFTVLRIVTEGHCRLAMRQSAGLGHVEDVVRRVDHRMHRPRQIPKLALESLGYLLNNADSLPN